MDWAQYHRSPPLAQNPQQSATLMQVLHTRAPTTILVNSPGGEMVLVTASPHLSPDGQLLHVVLNVCNITQLNYLKYQLEQDQWETRHARIEQFRSTYL